MQNTAKRNRKQTYAGGAIPSAFMEYARLRKERYGININRTIEDGLTHALEHKDEWTKNFD